VKSLKLRFRVGSGKTEVGRFMILKCSDKQGVTQRKNEPESMSLNQSENL
jgi:hypothetical protein